MRRPFGIASESLPIHPVPKRGELLSSWIVRLAWGNGLKVHTLCSQIGGNQATIWNRDIDRLAPDEVLKKLARLGLVLPEDLLQASLRPLADSLLGRQANTAGTSTWILPLGIWHRRRRGFGVQYCPVCLRGDQTPYIRRSWRLAHYTQCEHHNVLLHDRCPRCASPVTYFRAELGRRYEYEQLSMRTCSECGYDLSWAHPERLEWPDWTHEVATRTLVLLEGTRWTLLGQTVHEDAAALFRVLRQLIGALSSRSQSGELYDRIADRLWPYGYSPLTMRGLEYEQRSVRERHLLFGMAVWLLTDWPDRFREMIAISGTPLWMLVRDAEELPAWYLAEYRRLVGRPKREMIGGRSRTGQ